MNIGHDGRKGKNCLRAFFFNIERLESTVFMKQSSKVYVYNGDHADMILRYSLCQYVFPPLSIRFIG